MLMYNSLENGGKKSNWPVLQPFGQATILYRWHLAHIPNWNFKTCNCLIIPIFWESIINSIIIKIYNQLLISSQVLAGPWSLNAKHHGTFIRWKLWSRLKCATSERAACYWKSLWWPILVLLMIYTEEYCLPKPMSNILSASSNTTNVTLFKLTAFFLTKSISRPCQCTVQQSKWLCSTFGMSLVIFTKLCTSIFSKLFPDIISSSW